jgi:hypothetical protein
MFSLGEFFSPRVFYPQVINWAFQPWLISLEFFPHTCNNSSKVVNDVLMVSSSGSYCLGMM